MSTEAQLKAISNSELASGNQIPALKHRTVNNAIIEEMYDAQSRGNVLAGVQGAVSIASGDQVLVIRSGQAYLLDADEFGFVDALADLTDVNIPTPANDQVLAYNTSTSKWVAKDVNTLTSVVSISGTATTNALTKFTGTSSIGNSILSDNGTTVTIGGNLNVDSNLTVGTINSGTSSDFVKGDGSLDSTTYQDTSEKGQANGYAPLDSGAKIPLANLPDSILGQVSYQGTWAASTNTPTLANPPASTTKGEYYVASDDGTQFGIDFKTGDWIISNGTAWEKVDNTDAVTSVFGRLGNVVANAADYASFYVDFSSNQSITGQKTFGTGDLRIVSGGSSNLPTIFSNSSVGSSQESGFNTLGFNGNNNLFFTKGETVDFNGSIIAYDNTGIRTYTLPDASGTFAFTSDLDDYVTLDTAQSITGQKTFETDTLRVEAEGTANTVRIRNVNGGSAAANGFNLLGFNQNNDLYFSKAPANSVVIAYNNTTQRTYTLPDANGTLAFTSDINDTLDSVTDRGATTTNAITVGGATVNGILNASALEVDAALGSFGASKFLVQQETSTITRSYHMGSDASTYGSWEIYTSTSTGSPILTARFGQSGETVLNGNLTVDTDTLFVDSVNDGVGIGTTSPYNALTIEGSTSRLDLNNGGGASRKALLIEPLGYGGNAYARIESYDYGASTGGNLAINVTGGNVGIGTTSPATGIDNQNGTNADGQLRLGTSSQAGSVTFRRGGDGGVSGFIGWGGATDDTNFVLQNSSGGGIIKIGCTAPSTGHIQFDTNNTERMRIDSSGNVGIGTSSPSQKLQVTGAIASTGQAPALTSSSTFVDYIPSISSSRFASVGSTTGTAGSLIFSQYSSNGSVGRDAMKIDSSGNVGIGTSSPERKFEVRGTDQAARFRGASIQYLDIDANTGSTVDLDANNGHMTLSVNGSKVVHIESAPSEAMRIDSSGNVGIGTSSPSFQLQLSTDSAAKPTSALWTIASDARIKENIEPYTKGLDELMLINPITYDYNGLGGYEKGKGGVGIIAQEIKDVLPDSVSSVKAKLNEDDEEETDILNFNGHELTYVLINSIKELRAEIETLKQQINGQ